MRSGSVTAHFDALKDESLCVFNTFRDVDIWMPEMEQQEVPAAWWDSDADRSLLAGVFKHGRPVCSCHMYVMFQLTVRVYVVQEGTAFALWFLLGLCTLLFD